ncbi:serine hydrolase [Aerosakkonemataceae cyanobacterium BLCC-F154]|uniref:Serine hydrolase n=1 Tax=Floridaenema fluviatile BLCC-F154 TaxID=3153640 RepID=A0ABV4YA54_9CYAN
MQQRSPSPYQQLADLEERLNRANEYIQRLKQENSKLQRKADWFDPGNQSPGNQSQSRIKTGDFSLLRLEKATPRRRRRSSRYRDLESSNYLRKRRSRPGWKKLYQLRLAGLILAALTILWIIVSAISSVVQFFNRSEITFAGQNTELLKQLPTTPLLPPDIPPGTRAIALPTPTNSSLQETELVYNVTTPPNLKPSQQLQAVVDEMVQLIQSRRLSTEPLSIALINVKTGEIAGYQQKSLFYPASVVKMFWMVNVLDQMQRGILPNEPVYGADLNRMIQQSSNDAASRLVDALTSTDSGYNLRGEKYVNWASKRRKISEFFGKAGYEGIAIHQKTYPINYLRHETPEGRDMQMWNDPQELRNQISSEHAARLMYEIVTGKAVSSEASAKMVHFLARDLRLSAWRENTARFAGFNPVRGFLGQGLPSEVDFASKAGWTETGRHEVAFVRSREENGPIYVLAILGADEGYSKDWQLFPMLSQVVFDRMSGKNPEQQ